MSPIVWDAGTAVTGDSVLAGSADAYRIHLTTIPAWLSVTSEAVPRYFRLGSVGATFEGYRRPGERIIYADQQYAPADGDADGIWYVLEPGVSGIIYRGVEVGDLIVAAYLTRTAVQSITNNAFTALSWDVEVRDPFGIHSSGSPTVVTIPTPGWYAIVGQVVFDANSTGIRAITVVRDGATVVGEATAVAMTAPTTTVLNVSALQYLDQGQTIELQVYQNSGGALNVALSSLTPLLKIARMGG